MLKNSEKEATKNYNYILSTLKNEISLLQKDLPLISNQISRLQQDLRYNKLSREEYSYAQENINELRAEHSNKARAISFYNKKINDLKTIYSQQIRKIKSDYNRVNELANNKQKRNNYNEVNRPVFDNRFDVPNVKRNYEELYRSQLSSNHNNNYGNFRQYDPLIDSRSKYEYFANHQPRDFFDDLESIDNDIFNSNDLIYSNRNTYLDENFRINDFELTNSFDEIDSLYGAQTLRLPALDSSDSLSDLDFNSTFDIDFDPEY